ncbi:MAG: protein-methionine-sulfoxide reductase catalytic subunit MsrP [Leptolyngbyaceae bacterium]|nr:protein-methionine-sulfoxide reductase catalytic subunit MsrP [Leptolyngbyaceae bacterium]
MVFIRIPKPWHLPENRITAESSYFNRRRFLKTLAGASIGLSATALTGCQTASGSDASPLIGLMDLAATVNPDFVEGDRPLTGRELASTYNNFYEFGGTKNIWRAAQALPTDPWTVEVSGLVQNPKTYDLDDLTQTFDLEERVYRFRCVEAWSMVVPWIGFPMRKILEAAEPTSEARFVRFTSYYNESVTPGPGGFGRSLPWPYTEGLRIEEMANDLAFFAVGLYGQTLPKQNGAPIRMVLPWKYGFKGAKSIVKIEFVAEQPATYWNTLYPQEYKFESNVEPDVPHPRWSQAQEKLIGPGPDFSVEIVPTLPYNGYGDYVAALYA